MTCRKLRCVWTGVISGAVFLMVAAGEVSGQAASCDRGCLNGLVDAYLRAVVAHDPSKVLIAKNAKFTENAVPLITGEGLWKSASAAPEFFRIYVPDPSVQQVGFFGVMKESGKPIVLALRLKIEQRTITEVEQLVQRGVDDYALPSLDSPRSAFVTTVPSSERMARARMLEVAKLYYESIVQSNGDAAPYATDCERRENGLHTTSNSSLPPGLAEWSKIFALGCAAQMSTHALSYITSIDSRRVDIADPETGLVFGQCIFRRPEEEHTIKIQGVPAQNAMTRNFAPNSRHWAHIFKIQGNQIHQIEAMGGIVLPLSAPSGW